MKYIIQIPGKTFCFGEYAALVGGDALLMATKPGFEMLFTSVGELGIGTQSNPFHCLSPAGKYFDLNKEFFEDWHIGFVDHYQGRGGFGASTAQFLGLCYFKQQMYSETSQGKEFENVWFEYDSINRQLKPEVESSRLPSGYDLWSQMLGRVSAVKISKSEKLTEFRNFRSGWPFRELDFLIVPTGFKVATHNHLDQLDSSALSGLVSLSASLSEAWGGKNQTQFVDELLVWQKTLDQMGLVHSNSQSLLKELGRHPEILVAKGCGALGADVLFLVFMRQDHAKIMTILSEMRLKEAYDERDLWSTELRVQII